MSDNIATTKGQPAFFSVKEVPWHKLGKLLDNPPTSAEAIIHAGLDYEVAKAELFARIAKREDEILYRNEREHAPDVDVFVDRRYATYRTDTRDIFGIVSDRYQVVQNKEAFGFFDAIVGEGQAIYETAGALGKGETIFVTAKLPGHIRVANQDDIEKYLLLTMSHDGSKAITAMFTPIRVVCANTLAMALDGSHGKVYVRHTGDVKYNLERAHAVLGITKRLSESMETVLNIFANTKITEDEAKMILHRAFLTNEQITDSLMSIESVTENILEVPKDKKAILEKVWAYYHEGLGQAQYLGTLYGIYNAITGYFQNIRDYRTESSKFKYIFMGDGEVISRYTFIDCLKIAKEKGKL